MAIRRSAPLWGSLALVGAVVLIYGQVVTHEFVNWDDNLYIYENPRVRDGITSSGAAWAITASHASNWHPVTWISHMIDCELFGLHPGRHHAVNVAIHATNAVLLFFVLLLTTRRYWPSLLVAALFAVHPLRVESVAWASERKDVLSGLFWMLSMLAYAWYARRAGAGRYLLVAALMGLGLMAKPMLVTLPVVLLLMDVWPLGRLRRPGASAADAAASGRSPGHLIVEKLPLLVLSAMASALAVWAQRAGGALTSLEHVSLPARLANALVGYVGYLWKTVWPVGLAYFYPHPAIVSPGRSTMFLAMGAGAGLLLGWATVRVTREARHRPYLGVGWYWYLVTLAPVIGLVQISAQAMADRYAYLPLIGIYFAVAWGAADLAARRPRWRPVLVAGSVLVLAAFAAVAWFQVGTWRDSRTLYEHALRNTSRNFAAHHNLGVLFEEQDDLERALSHYQAAVAIHPSYAEGHYSLGHLHQRMGDPEAARESYEQALRIRPGYTKARNNLGNVLARLGRHDEAGALLEETLRDAPESAQAHNNLGVTLAGQGKLDEAAARYEQALRIDPGYAEAYNNLGLVRSDQGRLEEAAEQFEQAIRSDPDYADPYNGLGVVFSRRGQLAQAREQFERGLRIDPDNARLHNNLGIVFERQNRLAEAASRFRTAVRLDPDYAEAHNNLGIALTGQSKLREAAAAFRRAVEIDPDYADPYNGLGIVFASQGQLREAVGFFEQAVRLNPDHEDARNNLERARRMLQ